IDAKSLIDVSKRLLKKNIVPIDLELYQFLTGLKLTPIVVLNKIDKIHPAEIEAALDYFKNQINYDTLPEEAQEAIFPVSALKGTNLPQLRDIIRKHLRKAGVEEFERYIKLK
ncbi:MAG: GTP-binding protein, partial [Candidatus Heimdallarchaeota archaeon]